MNGKEKLINLLIMVIAAGWKILLLAKDTIPFNADEAVVGLMAGHILNGARPIFFYGQAYMGSLDAYLVAGLFIITGQSILAIRITQLLLYLGTIITTILIAKVGFQSLKAGWIAGFILAIPPVNTTLYTTASLGGYGEALLIGNIVVLVGFFVLQNFNGRGRLNYPLLLLLGILAGIGLWANGLTLVYSLPVGLVVLFSFFKIPEFSWRRLVGFFSVAMAGVFIGSLPWLIFALQNGFQALVGELLGSAVAVETQPWFQIISQHLINLVLFGLTALLGFRPPWEVRWLAAPLLPLVLIFWVSIIYFWLRSFNRESTNKDSFLILNGIGLCLVAGFVLTPFGVDPSGRYFLPLSVILALLAGLVISRMKKIFIVGLTGLILVFQLWGTLECALHNPPGITTQFNPITQIDTSYQDDLVQFLQKKGVTHGYSNYWVSYPVAFMSDEKIILSPRLPYHLDLGYTDRDDRYPPYTELVKESRSVAFVTTNHPALDNLIRTQLLAKSVTWEENRIGNYQIFFNLSQKVEPSEFLSK